MFKKAKALVVLLTYQPLFSTRTRKLPTYLQYHTVFFILKRQRVKILHRLLEIILKIIILSPVISSYILQDVYSPNSKIFLHCSSHTNSSFAYE